MIIEAKGFPCYLDGWLCVLDGSKIPTRNEYLKIIGQKLLFPGEYDQHPNWDAYLDWMRDLSWIAQRTITIVLENNALFLCNDSLAREQILKDFSEVIIPFWVYDASKVFSLCERDNSTFIISNNAIKTVNVILLEGPVSDFGIISTAKTLSNINYETFMSRKIPHAWSAPTLAIQDNRLCIGMFCTRLDGYLIKQGMCYSPHVFIYADIVNGNIVKTIRKESNKIVMADNNRISSSTLLHTFDIARTEYKQNGFLDQSSIKQIQSEALNCTREHYKPFMYELMGEQKGVDYAGANSD